MKFVLALLVGVIGLTGCASTNSPLPLTQVSFNDSVFPEHHRAVIETPQEVFGLTDEMRDFVDHHVRSNDSPRKQIDRLVKAIFGHTDMDLLYNATANTIAQKTFENREANCLSMTIMAYAMARYADMEVVIQRIEVPEFWERRNGYSLINGHVNLRIFPSRNIHHIYFSRDGFEVDFDPSEYSVQFDGKPISKDTLLAMFYNNKAGDALLNRDPNRAYAYLRAALTAEPNLSEGWVNLGVLYRQHQLWDQAEAAYENAIALRPSRTARENLAFLYRQTGRDDQAEQMLRRIKRQRQSNPFYHYLLGEIANENGTPREAIEHYKEALELDDSKHEFYFGLARAYASLGNQAQTRRYLQQAERHSDYRDQEQRYRNKLRLISRLRQ